MPSTDPMTCHVLDSTAGRPAAQVAVTLRCSTVTDIVFIGATDVDGMAALATGTTLKVLHCLGRILGGLARLSNCMGV
jgi:5-hydroxyisourate hydrolase-like protein (transthyretin family)